MSLRNGLDLSVQGVTAQTNRLSAIGNNIANVNTTGYKATDVSFETLLGDSRGTYVGSGVHSALRLNTSQQGTIAPSTSNTSLAIAGHGYFVVRTAAGATALTRAGAFERQANGTLVNTAGHTLLGTASGGAGLTPVVIPAAAIGITVGQDGALTATGPNGALTSYTIPLAQVRSPENLTALSGDTYAENDLSGPMTVGAAESAGFGAIRQASLEGSTSDLATQLSNMIVTQRSYEANSKVMQATSDMLAKLSTL